MSFVMGVDQGSSHTRAAVCDEGGRILAVGWAPGACHAYVGMQRAMDGVRGAAQQALANSGLQKADLACLFAGITGADWPDEYDLLKDNVLRLGFCPNVVIANDSIIAMRGGTAHPYGAILIAGTGGNCAVRAPDGREYIYGYFQEDALQGGAALARRALLAIYRAHTGRELPTSLTGLALQLFAVKSVDELLRADVEERLAEDKIHALVPLIFEAGCAGDAVANRILTEFGLGCAELVTSALQRLEMTQLELEVVLSGSVFKGKGGLLQKVIGEAIQAVAPRAALVDARYEPVVGALLLGLEHLGLDISGRIKANIDASARKLNLIRTVSAYS